MAIAWTATRASGSGAPAAQEFTTASFTGTSGSQLYLGFAAFRTDSVQPALESITGQGVSWDVVTSVDFDNSAPNQGTLWLATARGAGTTGTVVIRFTSPVQAVAYSVEEFSGVNGRKGWVQSGTDTDNTDPETSATLSAFTSSNNRSFHCRGKNSNVAGLYTANGTWTILGKGNINGPPACTFEAGWDNAATLSANWTQITGTASAGGIIIEMPAADSGGVWFV